MELAKLVLLFVESQGYENQLTIWKTQIVVIKSKKPRIIRKLAASKAFATSYNNRSARIRDIAVNRDTLAFFAEAVSLALSRVRCARSDKQTRVIAVVNGLISEILHKGNVFKRN